MIDAAVEAVTLTIVIMCFQLEEIVGTSSKGYKNKEE